MARRGRGSGTHGSDAACRSGCEGLGEGEAAVHTGVTPPAGQSEGFGEGEAAVHTGVTPPAGQSEGFGAGEAAVHTGVAPPAGQGVKGSERARQRYTRE